MAMRWAEELERHAPRALPEGLRLQDHYEIVGSIGEGGLGIVYLAWDHTQERHVAIKEYMPAVLATRDSASTAVVLRSPRHQDSFRIGLRSFINEARILARFDHPSLVRVLHHWEDKGTAYMAMPYYQGPTLAHALADLGRPPGEAELCRWLRPLLDALGTLHAVSCLHRDVAPDNILLTDAGPVLLDFGAARRVIDSAGQSSTVVFKPGFTPVEQYGELASMRQGPWTDLYALAAVAYTAIAGQAPVSSVERTPEDPLRPLSEAAHGRYSAAFLAGIDAALSVHPKDRPQSAAEFWARLSSEHPAEPAPPEAAACAAVAPAGVRAEAPARHAMARGFVPPMAASSASRVALLAAMTPRPRPRPVPARPRRLRWPALAGTAVLAGLVTAGYLRIGDPVRAAPPTAVLAPWSTPSPMATTATGTSTTPTKMALRESPAPARSGDAVPLHPVTLSRAAPLDVPDAASIAASLSTAQPVAAPDPVPRHAAASPASKPAVRAPGEPARAARREPRAPAAEPAAEPAPRRPVAVAVARAPQAEPAPAPGRCSELLLRASLEPLGAGEAAVLKKGCE